MSAAGLAALSWAAMAWWLLSHPALPSSDDALFFSNGVERFSVLEFRPHFPGYPGFIALGKAARLFTDDAASAIHFVSLLSALALPFVAGFLMGKEPDGKRMVLPAFLVTLTQPLLPLLGLNMMTDSTGLLLLVLALAGLRSGKGLTTGVLLAITLSVRPSYFIYAAAALAFFAVQRPGDLLRCAGAFVLTGLALLLPMFLLEGKALIHEGMRFVEGHFFEWGNTSLGRRDGVLTGQGWLDTAGGWAGGPVMLFSGIAFLVAGLLSGLIRGGLPRVMAGMALAGLLWTLPFQNPESARHLVPILLLSGLCLCRHFMLSAGLIVWQCAILIPAIHTGAAKPPVLQAADCLSQQPAGIVLSSHDLHLLRRMLPGHRITDSRYRGTAAFLLSQPQELPTWLLVSVPLPGPVEAEKVFAPDLPGRGAYHLYRAW